jgi:hypothetical protein
MPRITEKLEFVTGCAVKVSAKAWIGRKVEHENPVFCVNRQGNCFKREIS